jgi:hypothetical protein
MDAISHRSLKLPRRAISPDRSLTRLTQDKLSTRVYAQYPGLDRVMLNYLDMDGILELYAQNHETFETREALGALAQRFNLPGPFRTFRGLLKQYDKQYATVRSYNRINRSLSYENQVNEATYIVYQAALEGNIQAVINGFKLYPDVLEKFILNHVLGQAAEGGHEVIIDLLLDLGATQEHNEIFTGALAGGHINLITGGKYNLEKPIPRKLYSRLVSSAVINEQLGSLKYLVSLPEYLASIPNTLMGKAGNLGNSSTVDYLISQGANDYPGLVLGAMQGEHFELVLNYLDQVVGSMETETKYFTSLVIQAGRLDIFKVMVQRKLVSQDSLNRAYRSALKTTNSELIEYLEPFIKL